MPVRRLLRGCMLFLGMGAVLAGIVIWAAWALSPSFREKALIAGLFCGVDSAQKASAGALREYPTKAVAVSLVAFVNAKNLQRAPDEKETPERRQTRMKKHQRGLKVAERALETLCLLSGESFGTHFELTASGHSWGSLDEERWAAALSQMNMWAMNTFSGDALAAFGAGLAAGAVSVSESSSAALTVEISLSSQTVSMPKEEGR